MVDSTDRKNVKIVKEELEKMLRHEVPDISSSPSSSSSSSSPSPALLTGGWYGGGGAAWWQSLRAAKILVFANKQDLKGAMTSAELSDALNLHAVKDHDWHIQACCALTGEGYAPSPLFLSLRRSSCALS